MDDKSTIKAGILTFHRADNYGALLQTKALQQFLYENGLNVQVIDYRCLPIENDYRIRLIPKFRINPLKWSKQLAINAHRAVHLKKKMEKCELFRKNQLRMTKPVFSEEEKEKTTSPFQLILTGSDQIWSPKLTFGKDNWYAFKRITDKPMIIASYGASVGNLYYFKKYFPLYKTDLKKYDYLSVREEETRVFLSNELEKSVQKVVDPTLLLSGEYWRTLAHQYEKIKGSYVLYYDVEYNEIAYHVAMNIAKKRKLPLVHFNAIIHADNCYYVEDAGPEEFLGLILNAECIVTSSFHATVFSVLFKKKFITVPHPKTGVRVRNLLNDIKLNNRIVEDQDFFDVMSIYEDIEYDEAFNIIVQMKEKSVEFLDACIAAAKRIDHNE